MTDKEIMDVWCCPSEPTTTEFARLLLKAERDACVEACRAVLDAKLSNAHNMYRAGKEMAVEQCMNSILARNDLPTGA